MDMWFHFLVGVLIQQGLSKTPLTQSHLFLPLVFLAAFFSHFFVDWGSYLTFHPDETYKNRNPHDKFQKRREVFSGCLALTTILYFTFGTETNYFWAMGFSWGVDLIDWIIVRGLIKIGKVDEKYYHKGILHPIANWLRSHLAYWLPNWREKKKAYVMDFVLAAPIIYGLIKLGVFC